MAEAEKTYSHPLWHDAEEGDHHFKAQQGGPHNLEVPADIDGITGMRKMREHSTDMCLPLVRVSVR